MQLTGAISFYVFRIWRLSGGNIWITTPVVSRSRLFGASQLLIGLPHAYQVLFVFAEFGNSDHTESWLIILQSVNSLCHSIYCRSVSACILYAIPALIQGHQSATSDFRTTRKIEGMYSTNCSQRGTHER
jgi:hypothetical protein